MISIAGAARAVAALLDGLDVPVSPTPIQTVPITGAALIVDGPSLTAEMGVTACGYIEATVVVTAIAAGTDAQHVTDLYDLVDRVLAAAPHPTVRVVQVQPVVWEQADHPVRPAYELHLVTTLEA